MSSKNFLTPESAITSSEIPMALEPQFSVLESPSSSPLDFDSTMNYLSSFGHPTELMSQNIPQPCSPMATILWNSSGSCKCLSISQPSKTKTISVTQSSDKFLFNLVQSTKMSALLQQLHSIMKEDPSIKSIVFSQWTSMLDLVEKPLKERGFEFVRLDGAMSQANRQNAVDRFNMDPLVKVFLVSMKAGGLGLNLTGGSRVFLLDPWWNPAAEDQAIDRVHRIQQTREVIVYRFIIEGTVEERIRELQEKKRNLAQGALGEYKKDRKQLTMEELKLLFQD